MDRLFAVFSIFSISLFAVSFPSIAAVPNILFFIGKHFGTGVILSTAFSHLLQDAFTSLHKVNLSNRTGFIVLSALLAIFLIEYISTAYVDRLQSPPPTPQITERTPLLPPRTTHRSRSLSFGDRGRPTKRWAVDTADVERGVQIHSLPEANIGKSRQLVAILVLQLGIMIHSFVIGLTLAITGSQFASLLTAVIFHQLFEGLSLGIRISALQGDRPPSPPSPPPTPAPPTPPPPFRSSTRSAASPQEQEREGEGDLMAMARDYSARPVEPNLSNGTAAGCKARGGWAWGWAGERQGRGKRERERHVARRGAGRGWVPALRAGLASCVSLKAALAVLFAAMTPAGILAGLAWTWGGPAGPGRGALPLAQGLLSALSAGLLIYAATVEMLAGDFVMERAMWRSGVARQAVALGSLLGGVVVMGIVG